MTRLEGDDLAAALEPFRAKGVERSVAGVRRMFPVEADQVCLADEDLAEWLAAYSRSGWAAGVDGFADDSLLHPRSPAERVARSRPPEVVGVDRHSTTLPSWQSAVRAGR